MTTSHTHSEQIRDGYSNIPVRPRRLTDSSSPAPERKPVVLHGRPRSVEGEEAYLRSMMEQAATDIAAGW